MWTVGLIVQIKLRFQIFPTRNVDTAVFTNKEGELYKLQLLLKRLFVIKPRGSLA